jgi:hypothetical protein
MSRLGKLRCFVMMPFGEAWSDNLYSVIRLVFADRDLPAGWTVLRGDEVGPADKVTDAIEDEIERSDLIVADLGGGNPNVYYELGLAHRMGKRCILLSPDPRGLPFDVSHRRVLAYDPGNLRGFGAKLKEMLEALLESELWGRPAKFWSLLGDSTRISLGAREREDPQLSGVREDVTWPVAVAFAETARRLAGSPQVPWRDISSMECARLGITGGLDLRAGNHIALCGPVPNKCAYQMDCHEEIQLPARWRPETGLHVADEDHREGWRCLWLSDPDGEDYWLEDDYGPDDKSACIIARATTSVPTTAITIQGAHTDDTFWGVERTFDDRFWGALEDALPGFARFLSSPRCGVCVVAKRPAASTFVSAAEILTAAYVREEGASVWAPAGDSVGVRLDADG